MPWQVWLYTAAVLIPLAAFAVEILAGRWLKHWNAYIATAAIGTSCVLSLIGFGSYVAQAPEILAQHHAVSDSPDQPGVHEAARGPLAWQGSVEWAGVETSGLAHPPEGPVSEGEPAALTIPLGIYVDNLTVLMFVMVTFVATLIHVYSIGYMHGDVRYGRFFAYLSLFCFAMLGLVASASIFMTFIFWELVGVCSYLLIGHWYEEKKNVDAANKAFIVNRVGDVGMLMGLGLLWGTLGTFNIHEINQSLRDRNGILNRTTDLNGQEIVELRDRDTAQPLVNPATNQPRQIPYGVLVLAGLGIFAGCVGKSAQFPLHVWLPDAMAGPTPVSALIHAATMVAAGVYLVGRFFPVFSSEVLLTIAYTGGITLFIAASIAMVQTDYKKVLAYSTVSQLGFMMLGLGVGGWAAGLFHLLTHAFFKALLFLGAGSVYHAVHTYEMPVLGGLQTRMRTTATTMLLATLAISGVPLFSGFFSKDAILASALHFVFFQPGHTAHIFLFLLPAVGAVMTAFYMFRMWFLIFAGDPRGYPAAHVPEPAHGHHHDPNPAAHAHESEPIMTWPLILLAVPTVLIGVPITIVPFFGFEPILEGMLAYGEPVRTINVESARLWAFGASILIAASGIGLGVLYYAPWPRWRRLDPRRTAEQFQPLHAFLVNKWYFDELYHATFVRLTFWLAWLAAEIDRRLIDGLIDGSANLTVLLSRYEGLFDQLAVDKLVNLVAAWIYTIGDWSRGLQTGRLRDYLTVLALAVVVLFAGVFFWIR
jgi:proton-translocating NADH-quinone oxidoreductase chain L